MRGRVVEDYQAAYPEPLTMDKGEALKVGERDTEWPTFIWCQTLQGKAGWVPEPYITHVGSEGTALRDYSAAELSASVGEELEISNQIGGWSWCANSKGQSGWLPENNIEMLPSEAD